MLSDGQLRQTLDPYLAKWPERGIAAGEAGVCPRGELLEKLRIYLDLLLRWNERTNLTAIRDPEMIVQRHFGESLFTGLELRRFFRDGGTMLDFGSGAGFPGLPIQLLLPEVRVTLAESQGKKAAFLREAVRMLGLTAEVWAARVESMPPERVFDVVTLRAVDKMQSAGATAWSKVAPGGWRAELRAAATAGEGHVVALPMAASSVLILRQRASAG